MSVNKVASVNMFSLFICRWQQKNNRVKNYVFRQTWKQVRYLADIFWRRWTKEYLPLLHSRTKWLEPRMNLTVGDVVMLMDHTLPREKWKLGRVVETCPGTDGRVCVVKLKTQSAVLTRPVSKLCLLETTSA